MTRRLLVAPAAALVAGTAATLALDAAARTYGNPGAALLLSLTAVWLTQAITPLLRSTTRTARSDRP